MASLVRSGAGRVFSSLVGQTKVTSCWNVTERHCSSDTTPNLVGRHFLSLKDYQTDEIKHLLWTAADLKCRIKQNQEIFRPLVSKSVAMIFQKRSTRTRLSTETGMTLLGGHAVFLGPNDIHLGVNETLADSAKVLSRQVDLVFARVYGQSDLDALAEHGSVPVINGLSDLYHPLQILADFQALQERFGKLNGLRLAWVGDGNNVTHSLMMGCPKMGMHLNIATPNGYETDPSVMAHARELASQHGTEILTTTDPMEAVQGVDAVVTDTWVSMGQEEEAAQRLKAFAGYQVDKKMMSCAAPHAVFMHCLPRHPEEVTDEVLYDPEKSIIWEEAENRKWTVMAVMLNALQEYEPLYEKPNY